MSLSIYLTLNNNQTIWSWNITHNLNTMAKEAGLYKEVWRPDENEIYFTEQMIEPLELGLAKLKEDPDYYKDNFNPENGWGDYEGLVRFLESYLNECIKNPLAQIEASR